MSKKKKTTINAIQTLDPKDWFQARFFNVAEIDPLYVIIGFLQEYFGGYELHEETVDMFFVNEYEKAQIFKQLCTFYLASQKLESDVQFIKLESGHSYVQSKLICEKLKEYFTVAQPQFLRHKCFTLAKDDDIYKTAKELYGDRKAMFNFKRYSYLLGVVLKNRKEDTSKIIFPNAAAKVALTINILKDFSAFGDRSLRVDYFFGSPNATHITMSETNLIWNAADAFVQRIKNEV